MRKNIFLFISSFFLYSCSGTENTSSINSTDSSSIDSLSTATIKVRSKVITNELAGSNYRKRAMLYFVIHGKDTSDFKCYVTESLAGKVGLELRFSPFMTYRQQTYELQELLSEASKAFRFDSLQTIFLGRFISTGDLAIYVSKYYKPDGKPVSEFLADPRWALAADFNIFLRKYSRAVSSVSVEKMFLVDKEIIYSMSKIESDTMQIPNKIVDGLIWMKIGPRSKYE
jgi:hypothetical protein